VNVQKTNDCRYYNELSTHRLSRFWSNQLRNGVFLVHHLQILGWLVSLKLIQKRNTVKQLCWAPACYNLWKALEFPKSWPIQHTFFLFFQETNYTKPRKALYNPIICRGLGHRGVQFMSQLSFSKWDLPEGNLKHK